MNGNQRRVVVAILAVAFAIPTESVAALRGDRVLDSGAVTAASAAPTTVQGLSREGSTPAAKAAKLSTQTVAQSPSGTGIAVTPLSNGTLTATDLARTIIGGQGEVSNATFTGAPSAAGTFTAGPGTIPLSGGVVLSSGAATSVDGPNVLDNISTDSGRPGDASLDSLVPAGGTLDAAALEFDVRPNTFDLRFDFVFSSDEYNEYANTQFNDVFGFFVNGENIALLPDGTTNVTVDTINGGNPLNTNAQHSEFYRNNDPSDPGPPPYPYNTEMDGFTTVLNAVKVVSPSFSYHIKLAIADVSDHIFDSNVFITSQGCFNEALTEVADQPAGRVTVKYDPKFLWPQGDPDYEAKAALIAQGVKDRAEATLTEDLGLGFSVPDEVTIEARCQPGLLGNVFSQDTAGITDIDGTVRLQDSFLTQQMAPYVKARRGGQQPAIAGTAWANLVDHELQHTYQVHQLGSLADAFRVALLSDYAPIEAAAVLGQDLIPDTDDLDNAATYQSFLGFAGGFLNKLPGADLYANDRQSPYQVAALYQYLAERFGDQGAATLEQRGADMVRRLYAGAPHLDGVRQAIGAATIGDVIDALRDFYVTGYVREAPNEASLPGWLRILDETTRHGGAPGQMPPSWGPIALTRPDPGVAVTPSSSVEFARALERTRGVVYEVPLGSGLTEVRVRLDDQSPRITRGPVSSDSLRLGFVPVASSQVTIDPAFYQVGPSRSSFDTYDIPVVGMDHLAIAVVAGRDGRTYTLTMSARNGSPSLTLDPIPDVSYDTQAAAVLAFVHPSVDGVVSHGLPASVFTATIDGATATVSGAFDLGASEMLLVQPASTLVVGTHTLAITYGSPPNSASDSEAFQVTSGGGMAPALAERTISGTLRSVIELGGEGGAGTAIETRFALADAGVGLAGATVTVTVTDPAGVARTFPLPDEGGEFDSGYRDGAYGAALYATDLPGTYSVTVNASGLDSSGNPFAMQDTGSITLGPKVDTDGDGVADSVEPLFGLDPADSTDGAQDPDLDGATTAAELVAGSDPLDADTDGGDEADGSELAAGRSPTVPGDDAVLTDVAISALPQDGRAVGVSVAARDGATSVHVYRSGDDGLVDLGLHAGAGETFVDGPLVAGAYEYVALGEATSQAYTAPILAGPIDVADDVTAPLVRIIVNDDRPSTNQASTTVQFTDLSEPVSEMRLAETLDDLANASWVVYQSPAVFTFGSGDGFHEVYAEVRDPAGNISDPVPGTVELDTAAPSSSVGTIPAVTNSSIDIPYVQSDGAGSGDATVELYARFRETAADPWGAWALAATATTSPISYDFPAGDGEYEFYTVAIDLAGNREDPPASADAATTFDQTPPTTSAGPLDPSYSTATVDVPFSATDNLSGVATVELWSRYRATEADPWGSWTLGPTGSSSPITYTFGANGFYEFYSIGIDAAGNCEAAPASADAATEKTSGTVTTERVSESSTHGQANGASDDAFISADGRYVAFRSMASNLLAADTNGVEDAYMKDRLTGEISLASSTADGTVGDSRSQDPAISADGRFVTFRSQASNFVTGDTNGTAWDIFTKDLETGAISRDSVSSTGGQANKASDDPAISADGRYVVFRSSATNLVAGDTNATGDIFLRDRVAGTTTRISVADDGSQANGDSAEPAISDDGRYVAFESEASNLVSGDTNGVADIFLRDTSTGTTTRVSVATDGTQADGLSNDVAISADGTTVAFEADATNLVAGDTNGVRDVFRRVLATGVTTRVSVADDGSQGDHASTDATLSADGTKVGFASDARNLISGDTNNRNDVFIRDTTAGTTTRYSIATDGTQSDGTSENPWLTADGDTVAFQSLATNLVAGDTNATNDIFVRGPSLQ